MSGMEAVAAAVSTRAELLALHNFAQEHGDHLEAAEILAAAELLEYYANRLAAGIGESHVAG